MTTSEEATSDGKKCTLELYRKGRDYINHALKILPFIEAISELHPIAKG